MRIQNFYNLELLLCYGSMHLNLSVEADIFPQQSDAERAWICMTAFFLLSRDFKIYLRSPAGIRP